MKKFISIANRAINTNSTQSSLIYGPVQFRFFAMKAYECMSLFTENEEYKSLCNYGIERNFTCYSRNHGLTEIDEKVILGPFSYSNSTNITHELISPLSTFDKTGIIATLFPNE